jgi:two-component system response regulator YesN
MKRKWKVIIADDEFIIREGIRSSVDWDRLNLQVVAEAEDGEEDLELALREQVNILIVDLSMPIMDGLTLISELREQLPSCKIIIITGHDEFAYAKRAIKLKVDDYILKPVNPGQLMEVLTAITRRLELDATNEKILDIASKQIDKNVSLLRERFCLEWIEGDVSEDEIAGQLAFLQMPEQTPEMVGVIRWPEQSKGKVFLSEKDRQLLLFAIENVIEELIEAENYVHFRDQTGMIVVLVWGCKDSVIGTRIAEACQKYLNLSVLVSFQLNDENNDLPELYTAAKTMVNREARMSDFVRRARDIIEERYNDPELTLEGVADELGVSSVYLSRIFKQESGQSFIGMLTHVRIKMAIRMLAGTKLTMHEIAEKTGYDTQHYFSTSFKKVVGVPPNHYRKSIIEG